MDASLDLLPVAAFAFDAHDRIVRWNPAAATLYGLTPTEAVGQSVLLLIPHEETESFRQACEAVRRHGTWFGELRTMSVDYSPRIVETAWAGRDGHVVAVHIDVTKRQQFLRKERQAVGFYAVRGLARTIVAQAGTPAWLADQMRLVTDGEPGVAWLGAGRKVLATGTNRLRLELLNQLLMGHDYVVTVVDTLSEAVERLRRSPEEFAVAVIDFHSQNLAAAGEFRRVRPRLPVVNLTPGVSARRLLETLALAIAGAEGA